MTRQLSEIDKLRIALNALRVGREAEDIIYESAKKYLELLEKPKVN